MVWYSHFFQSFPQFNGHESEQTLGDSEEQGSLACCSPWCHKELVSVSNSQTHRMNHIMTLETQWRNVCVCVCVCSVMSDSCNPMDCSPPGSSEHEIFQARILEQVAISFSRGSSRPRDRTLISCVSCAGRRVLYQLSHQGSQWRNTLS